MKVRKQSIPLDRLCVENKGKVLRVATHRNTICVHVSKDAETVAYREFTFDQFCTLFEQLRDGIEDILTPP